MKKLTFLIFIYFLFIGICHATDAQNLVQKYSAKNADENFGQTINQIIETAKFFDEKYPAEKVNEDMTDDIKTFFPEMKPQQVIDFQHNVREWLSFYRYIKGIYNEYKEKMLTPDEPPLIVSDNQYYNPSNETEYIANPDNSVVIFTDIKTIVPYSGNRKDVESAEAKMIRDDNSAEHKGDFDELKYIVSRTKLSELPFYDVLYHSPLTGRKGIGSWQTKNDVRTRIITSQTGTRDSEKIMGVINVLLPKNKFIIANDGRHHKPMVSFEKSENLRNWNISYPIPIRLNDDNGTDWTAYVQELAIPVSLYVDNPDKPLVLRSDITLDICDADLYCYTEKFDPHLTLESEYTRKSAVSSFVEQQHYSAPSETSKKLIINSVKIHNLPHIGDFLEVKLSAKNKISSFNIFIDNPDGIAFRAPNILIDGRNIIARFMPVDSNTQLKDKTFEISANLNNRFFTRSAVFPNTDNINDNNKYPSFIGILFLAFLNGLLLYLSPFVFLVLAIKILSFGKYGARRQQNIRANCLYTVSGIFVGTLILGFYFIILKHLGITAVWGTQLNNISFVLTMLYVLVLMLWQINSSESTTFSNQKSNEKIKYFQTGLLLVLMVSITNLPFLSYPLTFASTGNAFEIITIFIFTFLGLSAPYIIINAFPQLIIFIPAPGTWLKTFKKLVNFIFCIAFILLAFIIVAQTSTAYVTRLLLYAILIFSFLWINSINRKLPYSEIDISKRDKARRIITVILVGLATVIYLISLLDGIRASSRHQQTTDFSYSSFSNDEIQKQIEQGNTVLISVGTQWCLSCRYNDFKLSSNTFGEIFNNHNIKLIKADLDETTSKLMKKYHRYELPFNILYSPLIPDGFILPKIMNENEIKELISNFTLNQPNS